MTSNYIPIDYHCFRCNAAHKFEHFKTTPEGNLFCQNCWKSMDSKNEEKRKCPVDQIEMNKHIIHGLAMIDKCPTCGGTWFDINEIEILLKEAEAKGYGKGFFIGMFF